ncbi:MAG: hypothetical protein J7K37_01410 [Candidatus Omnitrophica bacterium]|nr:hypothetical protein [Candidatus Omnitrophota bacterium]
MVKAISLVSGGLDSLLATKLILEQGIKIEGIYFSSVFYSLKQSNSSISSLITRELEIPLKILDISSELLEVVKAPKYGYGKNLNPCLDCRILMLKKAYQYMKESRAKFLITGEVVGERPFSQRKGALSFIEKDSGLEGLILRPLSAKLLKPTLAEEKGWVDRSRLLDLKGKSRKAQFNLAKELRLKNYLTPAGGCLLTEIGFSQRMRDLLRYNPDFNLKEVRLLKIGRHFRLNSKAKLIIARNHEECESLKNLSEDGDLIFYPQDRKGPLGLGRGQFRKEDISLASAILARYTDNKTNSLRVIFKKSYSPQENFLIAPPLEEEILASLRIA